MRRLLLTSAVVALLAAPSFAAAPPIPAEPVAGVQIAPSSVQAGARSTTFDPGPYNDWLVSTSVYGAHTDGILTNPVANIAETSGGPSDNRFAFGSVGIASVTGAPALTGGLARGFVSGLNGLAYFSSPTDAYNRVDILGPQVVGGDFGVIHNGAGNTHAAGVQIEAPTVNSSGTFTRLYGIFIDDQTVPGAVDGNYQIYSAGSLPSYFAGPINQRRVILPGFSNSDSLTVQAAAVAGTYNLIFPGGSTDFSATGGAHQIVRQSSAGAALTVSQLALADLSDGSAVAPKANPSFSGHMSFTGNTPALSACGTGSPAIDANATDNSGRVTVGTVATGCVVTFASAFASFNHCQVSSQSAISGLTYIYSLSAITVSASVLGGDKFDYRCDGV